jgi:membrane protease YdiL (CAAX protease family)
VPCTTEPTASTHMKLRNFFDAPVEPQVAQDPSVVCRRRRVVTATLVVGTAILGGTLAAPANSALFYALGLLAAVTWIIGALLSGPIPIRQIRAIPRRLEIAAALLLAAALFSAFLAAKLLAEHLPLVSGGVASVLATADAGPRVSVLTIALLNGIGEEMLFRGSLQSSFTKHAALWTAAIYTLVTIATLNAALVVTALVMGAVFSAERRASGGILAPILTHLTWSTLILLLLPR